MISAFSARNELPAKRYFESFRIGIVREAPSDELLIVAPLPASASSFNAAITMEFMDQI